MYAVSISPYPTQLESSRPRRLHDLTAVSASIFLLLPLGAGAILGV
jgi:hypothetical protein